MRKTLIAALALSAAAHAAFAQEAATDKPKAEARAPRIAVINLEKVWSDSLMGKGYAAQMEALANDIKATETKKQTINADGFVRLSVYYALFAAILTVLYPFETIKVNKKGAGVYRENRAASCATRANHD